MVVGTQNEGTRGPAGYGCKYSVRAQQGMMSIKDVDHRWRNDIGVIQTANPEIGENEKLVYTPATTTVTIRETISSLARLGGSQMLSRMSSK
jgi:hypothetical protein